MPSDLGLPHIAVVIGTRPEIVKLAHIVRILGAQARLIHSGQHTDTELSGVFLASAGLPAPHMLSGVCGKPRYAQVGRITEQLGELFARRRPAAVVVQGDTNTAMAAAQAGNYCGGRSCTWRPGSAPTTGTCPRRSTAA